MAKSKIKVLEIDLSDLPLLKIYYPSLTLSVDSTSSNKTKLIIEGKNFSKPPKQSRTPNGYVANIVVTVESQSGKNLIDYPKRVKIKSDGTINKQEAFLEGTQTLKIYATDEYTNINTRVYIIKVKDGIITYDDLAASRTLVQSIGGG